MAACCRCGGDTFRLWSGGTCGHEAGAAEKKGSRAAKVAAANSRCPSLAALAPIQRQPKVMIFTFIDLGPRLIVATHHQAVGVPITETIKAIADVMVAFRGDEAQAHRIIREYRSVFCCSARNVDGDHLHGEAPKGFYGQLVGGKVPSWLQPLSFQGFPFMMWRVVG